MWEAIEYVARNKISGDFVECGVWRGGLSILAHRKMMDCGLNDRKLFLYDTFEGMSTPTSEDLDLSGRKAFDRMEREAKRENKINVWAYASEADVRSNINLFTQAPESFILVKGKVEDTIPATIPDSIAILRLDTDWYESTKHELMHLYNRLSSGGVILIDDYGVWQGCRLAVDEFFSDIPNRPYFVYTDKGGLAGIKPYA